MNMGLEARAGCRALCVEGGSGCGCGLPSCAPPFPSPPSGQPTRPALTPGPAWPLPQHVPTSGVGIPVCRTSLSPGLTAGLLPSRHQAGRGPPSAPGPWAAPGEKGTWLEAGNCACSPPGGGCRECTHCPRPGTPMTVQSRQSLPESITPQVFTKCQFPPGIVLGPRGLAGTRTTWLWPASGPDRQ